MDDARALAGVHFPEFLKFHIKHKMNGLDAYKQAVNFMAELYPTTVAPAPANGPVISPCDRNATEGIPSLKQFARFAGHFFCLVTERYLAGKITKTFNIWFRHVRAI